MNKWLSKSEISKYFSEKDSTKYHWKYRAKRYSLLFIIINSFIALILVPFLIYFFISLIGLLFEPLVYYGSLISFYIFFGFFLIVLVFMLILKIVSFFEGSSTSVDFIIENTRSFPRIASILFLVVISSPLFMPNHFINNTFDRFAWFGLYIEQIINSLTFNILTYFGFNISNIGPIDSFGNLMIGILRFLITAGIIENILFMLYIKYRSSEFIGTAKEFKNHIKFVTGTHIFLVFGGIEITVNSRVEDLFPKLKMYNNDFTYNLNSNPLSKLDQPKTFNETKSD